MYTFIHHITTRNHVQHLSLAFALRLYTIFNVSNVQYISHVLYLRNEASVMGLSFYSLTCPTLSIQVPFFSGHNGLVESITTHQPFMIVLCIKFHDIHIPTYVYTYASPYTSNQKMRKRWIWGGSE